MSHDDLESVKFDFQTDEIQAIYDCKQQADPQSNVPIAYHCYVRWRYQKFLDGFYSCKVLEQDKLEVLERNWKKDKVELHNQMRGPWGPRRSFTYHQRSRDSTAGIRSRESTEGCRILRHSIGYQRCPQELRIPLPLASEPDGLSPSPMPYDSYDQSVENHRGIDAGT